MKINGKQSGSKRSTFWVEANSRVRTMPVPSPPGGTSSFSVVLRDVTLHLEAAQEHASATYEHNGRRFGSEREKRGEGKKSKKKILFTLDRTKICIEFYYAPL